MDRSLAASITDAREAAINAVVDLLLVYKSLYPAESCAGLVTSYNTRLLPLYILALMKHVSIHLPCVPGFNLLFFPIKQPAFRIGISTKVDERVAAMEKMKSLPICHLMTYIYPDLYPVHYDIDYENEAWPAAVQLTFANFERSGVYLMDTHDSLYLYICKSVNAHWLSDVFGVSQWNEIPDDGDDSSIATTDQTDRVIPLPVHENRTSMGLRCFIEFLMDSRPFRPHFFVMRWVFAASSITSCNLTSCASFFLSLFPAAKQGGQQFEILLPAIHVRRQERVCIQLLRIPATPATTTEDMRTSDSVVGTDFAATATTAARLLQHSFGMSGS